MCTGDSAFRLSVKRDESDSVEKESVKVLDIAFDDGRRSSMWRLL